MYDINNVAQVCKASAVICGILSFLGTFIIAKAFSIGILGYLLCEFVCCLLIYAVGEIIEKLSEISHSNAEIIKQLKDMDKKD